MNLMSRLVQRQLALDPPLTRDLAIERDLPVPMPDGTILLADRWAPRTGGDRLPVAVMRTPYGRGALITAGMVRPLAERGFQVILQSVRGTFGSGQGQGRHRATRLALFDQASEHAEAAFLPGDQHAPAEWGLEREPVRPQEVEGEGRVGYLRDHRLDLGRQPVRDRPLTYPR